MPGLLDLIGGLLGGNLLGGQGAAPPQRPAPPPRELPGYGGTENPLSAGFQNFANAGSPMGAIGGLVTGLTSGQRTDPVGAYQQMANMTYRALLDAGVPEVQARLGAINPGVQKEIIGRMFPKWQAEHIGNALIPFDPTSGRLNPRGGYVAPEWRTVQPGETGGTFQPPVMPQGGGVPAPGGPIQSTPLAPIPAPGPQAPGATSAAGPLASPTGPGTLGGPGPATTPPSVTSASSGRGVPPPAASGFTPLVTGMSPKALAAERAAGETQGTASQKLPAATDAFDSAIKMVQDLKKHPGKFAAVGRYTGVIPALGLSGNAADFVHQLEQAQTTIAPLVDGNEKTKVEATGTDRRVDPVQFDRQLDNLIKTLQGKKAAAQKIAGEPGAPEAPAAEPSPAGTGAAGASAAGQGAPSGGWVNVGGDRVRLKPGQ